MTQLRPYQQAIVDGARSAFRSGLRTALIQLPTGGGKTVLGSFMVQGSSSRGLCCWWLVHRRELLNQASRTFHEIGIPHGYISGGRSSDPSQRVQIGSVQTVARRLDRLPAPDLIVFDEAHHLGAAQWQAIFDAYPAAKVIGLTATPWRLDGKGLGHWFETMISGPSVADLMEGGSLSRYRLFAPSTPDTSSIATQMGDFKNRELASVMDKPSITGDAVQHYRQLAGGRRAVAFACSIEHSQHVVAQFAESGIAAEHVDGQMDHGQRDAIIARFVAGETLVLSNADLLGEGFDVPAIEAAILLRPTQSLSLHLQQVGRALRPSPGKPEAIILDHAGNSLRHGLPDDDRAWTLDDREKRKKKADDNEISVRQCSKCFRVYRPAPACPGCGFAAPSIGRGVEEKDGVLAEIDPTAVRAARKHEERRADTVDQLIELGRARGYKNPEGWARNYHAARDGVRQRYGYGARA
jgi:DNA repair protein RadD